MLNRVYVELHVIQSVPPSCLNRDDTGSPKTAVYGGVRRGRVSSQSWNKAVRTYFNESLEASGLGDKVGVRTKQIVVPIMEELLLLNPEMADDDARKKAMAALLQLKILKAVASKKDSADADAEESDDEVKDLMVFLSKSQIKNIAKAITEGADEKTLQLACKEKNSVDLALFGRMMASNDKLNVDGGAYTAQILSTHKVSTEYDFFTATDDLAGNNDHAGGGHLGVSEFNSFTMYRHVAVSVPELLANLTGDVARTEVALKEFIRAFVEAMPEAKQRKYNAYTYPSAVMITLRKSRRPVSLMDAFENPIVSSAGYIDPSIDRMVEHYENVNRVFAGAPLKTYIIGDKLSDNVGERVDFNLEADLDKICREALESVTI